MDNPFYNNEIVNNLFTSKPDFENIMNECDKKFTTVYAIKSWVSTYYNVKCKRQDLTILLDEKLTEQDIDDFINTEIQQKIVLNTNCYYKELIDHYLGKQNKCKRLPKYYHNFFYKKPLACILLLEQYTIDRVVNTYTKLMKKEIMLYGKIVSDDFSIDYAILFSYRLEIGLKYYKQICSQLEIDVDIPYYINLYVHMNTRKIEELLKFESTEVKDILKLCYEDTAY
tara:strand:+ start:557 stop:1237 length:681 start_codon:yes stop_codon:yes gene_type:complete